MNVSGISSPSTQLPATTAGSYNQRAQDFRALRSALQSGDLTGAQQAFANLQKDAQNSPNAAAVSNNAAAQPASVGQISKDFQTLQTALQAGDLSGAQSAFATLKQDLQSTGASQGAHHHHHHKSGVAAGLSAQGPATTVAANAGNTNSALNSLLNTQA